MSANLKQSSTNPSQHLVINTPCPACGAGAGAFCRTRSGALARHHHVARLDANAKAVPLPPVPAAASVPTFVVTPGAAAALQAPRATTGQLITTRRVHFAPGLHQTTACGQSRKRRTLTGKTEQVTCPGCRKAMRGGETAPAPLPAARDEQMLSGGLARRDEPEEKCGAISAPRNRSGHDLTERPGAEPDTQELPLAPPAQQEEPRCGAPHPERPNLKCDKPKHADRAHGAGLGVHRKEWITAPEAAPRPAELTMPWGVRKTLADALAALEEGRLADARGLVLGCLGKPANTKPASARYQELLRGAAPQAGSAQLAKVLEEVASRVRLAREGLRDVDGKRLPKAAQDKLTTVRGGTLPALLEYVEAQAALAGVELEEPGEALEGPEEEGLGECGAPYAAGGKQWLCARNRGHGGNHESGEVSWSEVDSELARRKRPPAATGEDEYGHAYEWVDTDMCQEPCTLLQMEGRVCERAAGHEGEHAAPVAGEPPLTWGDPERPRHTAARSASAKHQRPPEDEGDIGVGDTAQFRRDSPPPPDRHTPGPWEVKDGVPGELLVVNAEGEPVATLDYDTDDEESQDTAAADGALMAAAPDMAAALVAALEKLEDFEDKSLRPLRVKMRAALSKAGVAR